MGRSFIFSFDSGFLEEINNVRTFSGVVRCHASRSDAQQAEDGRALAGPVPSHRHALELPRLRQGVPVPARLANEPHT